MTSHALAVVGAPHGPYSETFDNAGTEFGCTFHTLSGALPNEHGTWLYGRCVRMGGEWGCERGRGDASAGVGMRAQAWGLAAPLDTASSYPPRHSPRAPPAGMAGAMARQ